jgi:TonB family protein
MSSTKLHVLTYSIAIALTLSIGRSASPDSTPPVTQGKGPIEVGRTRYKDLIIPVFDGLSVKCDKTNPPRYPTDLKRAGVEGKGVVMIVVDEKGLAVDYGIVSSTPNPQFGLATLAAAKTWHYFPLADSTGKPFVHALRMEIKYTISND